MYLWLTILLTLIPVNSQTFRLLFRMASNLIISPVAHVLSVSASPAVIPILHRGGKIPCPHFRHIPYSRSNSISFPSRVSSFLFFFPFFNNSPPHFAHTAAFSPFSHSALCAFLAVSVIIRARISDSRLSISSSISRIVAFGCSFRHSLDPSYHFFTQFPPFFFSLSFFHLCLLLLFPHITPLSETFSPHPSDFLS